MQEGGSRKAWVWRLLVIVLLAALQALSLASAAERQREGGQVTWIGDSLSSSSYAGPQIQAKLPGVDLYAVGGREFDGLGKDPESGVELLRRLEACGELRGYVVLALGTNNHHPPHFVDYDNRLDAARIEAAIKIAGPGRSIVLVTNFAANLPDYYSVNNQAIRDVAARYSNVYLADWAAVASSGHARIAEDGLPVLAHPEGIEAKQRFVDCVYQALQSAVSSSL